MAERKSAGVITADKIWAENKAENRQEPNSGQYAITETDGWPIDFSQVNGKPVERKLMNTLFHRIMSALYDVNRFGSNLVWNAAITYEIGALVIGSDNKTYRAYAQNTNVNPVTDNGTKWKLALFNNVNGTAGNLTVSLDSKNNITINTAVNLSTKANANLDNVASGSLVGKFQDGATTSWKADEKKLTVDIKDGSVKATKVNGTDKKSWADKVASVASEKNTIVSRGEDGWTDVDIRTNSSFKTENFNTIGVSQNNYGEKLRLSFTPIANVKSQLGIDAILKEVQTLKQQLADSKITNFKEQHPVGCIWVSYLNQNPPYQNQHNIKWELLPEGYAVMTGKGDNTGKTSGANRLDTGTTAGHAITIEQMVAHNHIESGRSENLGVAYGVVPNSAKNNVYRPHLAADKTSYQTYTSTTGGSKEHSHKINALNIKLLLWRRTA